MKIAIPIWNGRIAPVFDSAGNFLLLEVEQAQIVSEASLSMPQLNAIEKAEALMSAGMELLICGAASKEALEKLSARGIKVFSYVAGEIREVIRALHAGETEFKRYTMPGCRCPRRNCRNHGWRHGKSEYRIKGD